jgi:hypothetical protein
MSWLEQRRLEGDEPKKKDIWGWALLAFAVFPFCLLALATPGIMKAAKQVAQTTALRTVQELRAAIDAHFTEYSFRPTGDHADILATLRGGNPRKIGFFKATPQSFNAKGELIDPWGTSYLFDLTDLDFPRIWSCGKNRQDDGGRPGSDDVVSWR